jgi:hypothetical protein
MAISTYAELQTAIAVWMGRPGDTVVATYAPDFISMFEAWFKSRVRVRRMLTTTTLTIDAATEALPSDFLEVRNIYLTGSPSEDLQQAGLDWIRTQYDTNTSGRPKFYNVGGSTITFAPVPDGTYSAELTYYGFTNLSNAATTNWLLTYYPHVYLRGALREAAGWEGAGNHESMPILDASLKEAIADMEREDMRVMTAADSASRLDTWTP